MKVKIKNESLNTNPSYATKGAAAFDIKASEGKLIFPGETQIVGTGLFVEIPEHHALFIFSRSGLAAKGIIVGNGVGVVDSDYRGEIKIILRNVNLPSEEDNGANSFKVAIGDRIAQGIVMPVNQIEFIDTKELNETSRGTGGFGSTGR